MRRLAFLLASFVFLLPQQFVDSRAIQNQVITNTEQLRSLEYRVNRLETGGSSLALETANNLAVLRNRVDNDIEQFRDLRTLVYSILGFVIVQLAGLAWLGVRYNIDKQIWQRAIRHSRSEDDSNE